MSLIFENFITDRKMTAWTLSEAMARARDISRLWPNAKIDHDEDATEQWISIIYNNSVVAIIFTKAHFGIIEVNQSHAATPSDFFPVASLDTAELSISEDAFSSIFERKPPDGMSLQKFSALDLYALTAT